MLKKLIDTNIFIDRFQNPEQHRGVFVSEGVVYFRGRPSVFQFSADHKDMSRKARIDAAGALHHIMGRGIDRSVIFRRKP